MAAVTAAAPRLTVAITPPTAIAPILSEGRATIDGVPRWDDGPLVGRAEELARLMAHVDHAVAGRPSAAAVPYAAQQPTVSEGDELRRRCQAATMRV